ARCAEPRVDAFRARSRLDQQPHSAVVAVFRRHHPVRRPAAPDRARPAGAAVARGEAVVDARAGAAARSEALRAFVLTCRAGSFWTRQKRLWICMAKQSVLGEFISFLRQEKKYWIAPIAVVLV